MGASSSTITLALQGVDNASAAIERVKGKLGQLDKAGKNGGGTAAVMGKIGAGAKVAAGATVAAVAAVGGAVGAYAGEVKKLADEYSNLSGRALDAGASAKHLQQLSGAMQQANIKGASIEMLSQALEKMQQTTGQVGVESFAGILKGVAQLGTEQERVNALTQVFGKQAGMAFLQLTNDGGVAVDSLFQVGDTIDAVSNAGVDRFASIGTAWAAMSQNIHANWSNTMLAVADVLENAFGMTFEDVLSRVCDWVKRFHTGLVEASKWVVYCFMTIPASAEKQLLRLKAVFVGLWGGAKSIFEGGSFADGWDRAFAEIEPQLDALDDRIADVYADVFSSGNIPADEIGDSLADAARSAQPIDIEKLKLEAGNAGAAMGRSMRDSIDFGEAIGAGSGKAQSLLAKLAMQTKRAIAGVAGGTSTVSSGRGSVGGNNTAATTATTVQQILAELVAIHQGMNFATV